MIQSPSVSVLMPVYNAEKYLKYSIESILNQTFLNFQFFIVNDGSDDNSENVILDYANKDKRIVYIKNEHNEGLIHTLNKGIDIINSKYLVRMDADDIAMPERIKKQVEFMESNPEILISGTQIQYFGESNNISDFPLNHKSIHARLLFGSALAHPTIIIQLNKLKAHGLKYDESYLHAEDYNLWTRAAKVGKLANIDEVLLHYRLEGQNITINNWHTRENRLKKIASELLQGLGLQANEENLLIHIALSGNSIKINDLSALKKYSDLLILKNKENEIYDSESLEKEIQKCWKKLFYKVADEKKLKKMTAYFWTTKSISFAHLYYFLSVYRLKKFN